MTFLLTSVSNAVFGFISILAAFWLADRVMDRLGTARHPGKLSRLLPGLFAYSLGMHAVAMASVALLDASSFDLAASFRERFAALHGIVNGFIVNGRIPLIPRSHWQAGAAFALTLLICTPWYFLLRQDTPARIEYVTLSVVSTLAVAGWAKLSRNEPVR